VRAPCFSHGVRISRAGRPPQRSKARCSTTPPGLIHNACIVFYKTRISDPRGWSTGIFPSLMLDVDRCWVKSSKPRVSVADRGPCLQRSSCSQSVHERGRTCPSVGPRAVTLRVPGDPRPTKKEKETERDEVERLRRSAELRLGEPKTEIHVRKGRIGIAYGHEKRGTSPTRPGHSRMLYPGGMLWPRRFSHRGRPSYRT